MYFTNTASLIAQTTVPLNTEFIVGGRFGAGDGGGGTFVWVPVASPALRPTDDGGIVFHATNDSTGYFERLYSGPINVRWFGASGTGLTDDTIPVQMARASKDFADSGTLYFPKGVYVGEFIFDSNYPQFDEINIKGDGHGTILRGNGATLPDGSKVAVVTLGYRNYNNVWAKISDLVIDGQFGTTTKFHDGVHFANPSTAHYGDGLAGYWVFERILFINCYFGVQKLFGNIGNHFIDCSWRFNVYGVYAIGGIDIGMHPGADRYSGGHVAAHTTAGLSYVNYGASSGEAASAGGQIIIDGVIFEGNGEGSWAIQVAGTGGNRMMGSALSLRNVWFERNGGETGGDLSLSGVRSARIDDTQLARGLKLRESSVNMYNCMFNCDVGGALNSQVIDVDEKSSIVAYEHRYLLYPTSKIFVNSISYDGVQDIGLETWQPTSVWGPLRCVTSTKQYIAVTNHFDTVAEPFTYLPAWAGTVSTVVTPIRVLGAGSGRISLSAGDRIVSNNVIGTLGPDPTPRYVVWSIHTYLQSQVPSGHNIDELYGEIVEIDSHASRGNSLGRVYFKFDQWTCSYGMKLVDATSQKQMRLEFDAGYAAVFYITDYQIVQFDDLYSANSFVNSREFAIGVFHL